MFIILYFYREGNQKHVAPYHVQLLEVFEQKKKCMPMLENKKKVYAYALHFPLNTVEKRKTSGNIEATVNAEIEASSVNTVDEEVDHVQPP